MAQRWPSAPVPQRLGRPVPSPFHRPALSLARAFRPPPCAHAGPLPRSLLSLLSLASDTTQACCSPPTASSVPAESGTPAPSLVLQSLAQAAWSPRTPGSPVSRGAEEPGAPGEGDDARLSSTSSLRQDSRGTAPHQCAFSTRGWPWGHHLAGRSRAAAWAPEKTPSHLSTPSCQAHSVRSRSPHSLGSTPGPQPGSLRLPWS